MRFAALRFAFHVVSMLLTGIPTNMPGAQVSPASAAALSTVEGSMARAPVTLGGSPAAANAWDDLLREPAGGGLTLASGDTAYFAGGSFWVLEAIFESHRGVASATTGYAGGDSARPVARPGTGPAPDKPGIEAVEVVFNQRIVSYEELLDLYWRSIDPTQEDGRPCEAGSRYRAIVFYRDAGQRDAVLVARERLARRLAPGALVATAVEAAGTFTRAADEDQDVYRKQRDRYRAFLSHCKRAIPLAGTGQE